MPDLIEFAYRAYCSEADVLGVVRFDRSDWSCRALSEGQLPLYPRRKRIICFRPNSGNLIIDCPSHLE